jgi:hypothetical protein
MTLTDAQREQVAAWIAAGAKLSEIQNRLAAEFGLRLTYMEVRLLVDDLKLTPKDQEPAKPAAPIATPANKQAVPPPGIAGDDKETLPVEGPTPGTGGVSVTVDKIARPGAIVSGKVTFSDAQQADWYLDQMGRLGLAPKQQGYKPSPLDVQEFQMALQEELAKQGF